ncbi:MAG TPA: pseudouridine-5'-phosphate glycosidase [Oligoflexus sp.]|uniref:pseudouridine-5'-phosphate glycosidase n=1 Tax=Oligoflexus sp. TaxID=1971216 RepID=UPI002D7F2287|nr:pseudouridine-5'-phosphate glycosidase [Oligoflexus sp.]HET9235774.1 pseudouridine-5'-phosphate glycosidase [Oligoflexus sp.]
MHPYLDIHPEVAQAKAEGRAVVALESTIIAHGMPYPQNVATAREVEAIIRSEGAVPATIGIIKGRVKIGLTDQELESFGQNRSVEKVSRRDFPLLIAQKMDGATTVAGTMIAAQWAGIQVFVTGGLGGVHRGVSESWDISADLTELAQTDVAVVCAGVKSILDIPKTLEVLETSGVPVIGYQTDEFPAFFTRSSGCPVLQRVDELSKLAAIIKTKYELGLRGGVVVANPIPLEHEIPAIEIMRTIEEALRDAQTQGIQGKAVTPFLLKNIVERTQGRSLKSNIALVKNNARVGAQLAVSLTQFM